MKFKHKVTENTESDPSVFSVISVFKEKKPANSAASVQGLLPPVEISLPLRSP
jgi:hypothetical protein